MFFVAADLGTSGIKTAVVDTAGRLLAEEYRDTGLVASGPGRMEQDPTAFYRAVLHGIRAAVEKSGIDPARTCALALDGQMGGIIGVDSGFPPGSEGLQFIPYLGGRQCPYDDTLRGAWIGLNWGHKKEHLFRAVLEGLAFALRGCALIAGYGLGVYSDLTRAAEELNRGEEHTMFRPEPQSAAAYRRLYPIFKEAVTASLKETMKGLQTTGTAPD